MAGAGTEFTRIAGPIRPGFGAIAGVSQGVVIARINQDITLADFELSVRNALRDIEYAYWDLYLAYRVYDATAASHRSAHQTWKELNTKVELGSGDLVETFQAEDRFFQTRAQLELSLNSLYTAETALRRLIGLPMNDGTVLRPSTEPERGELQPDWKTALNDGLSQRVELRRQKWQIRSLQLQLSAAKSLIRPQLDAVGSYAALGSGDSLISQSSSSMYGGMTGNSDDAWTLGLEMSLPVGLRQSRSQMRNYELQLAKNNAILSAQEQSIAHDIAQSMQDLSAAWAAANSNQNRIQAAEGRVQQLATRKSVGVLTSDLVLRAQASLADAEVAYYQQLINYNKSIAAFHLATGNLLPIYNVTLAEGDWDQQAIDGAFICVTPHVRG
ncbi:MAG: TolC family protein, partial [Planctomycetaceae bacterium]